VRHAQGGRKDARSFESMTCAHTSNCCTGTKIQQWMEKGDMSKLSDCRFRRIVTDLSDCEDAIDELFNGVTDDGQPLSDDELRAARRLISSCISIVTRVGEMANLTVDLDGIEQSIDAVLRKENSAPLEALYDARNERILLSKAAK
jgi:hypothetical protein